MGGTVLLVRVVAAGALVGFLVFCVAHVVVVWRKRNAKKGGPGPAPAAGRRLAWGCLLAGGLLLPAAAVQRELIRGEGTLTGEGLYILRAQDDLDVEWLCDGDSPAAGDVLARFGSGPRAARAHEFRARVERAEAEQGVLELLPLSPDPELTRQHQAAAQERTQAQQELGQAVIALEVAGRDLTAQVFSRKESLARVELALTERRKELDRVTLKSGHAGQQLTRSQNLSASGSLSVNESQDIVKAARDADIERASLAQEVKHLVAEKAELRDHLDKLEARRTDPSAPLRTQVATLTARVARLEAEEAESKAKVKSDLARSGKLRGAEKVQAAAKVREQQAAVDSLNREREVVAPFAGTLAYRATSPNAIRSRGTLAVLAPADGFLLTARMADADADALRNGAEAMIELGDDSTERRVPARFHKTTALAHEPGFAAVQLACRPPAEMVRRLAEGEKLTASFAWHPPFAVLWPFRAGLLFCAVGAVGLFLSGRRSVTRSAPPVEPAGLDRSPAEAKLVVGRLLGVADEADAEDTPAGAEVPCAEPVAELDLTTNAEGVTGLLARLSQISSVGATGKPLLGPDWYPPLRRTSASQGAETALSGEMQEQPSGRF